MLRTWLRAWPNHSGYNATRSHSAPRYLTPGWASSCRGAPDAVVISSTGGNLQRHSCQTQSPKQELLIALASVICLIPAVSILRKHVSSSLPEPYLPSHQDRDGVSKHRRGVQRLAARKENKSNVTMVDTQNTHMKSQQPTNDK